MRPLPALALCTITVFAAGCRPASPAADSSPVDSTVRSVPGGPVRLTLDRSTYRSGAPVQLTLVNTVSATFGYNACTRTIERQSAGGWTAVPEPDRVCTMELRLLEGNATVTEQTELPPNLAAGSYRVTLRLSDETTNSSVAPVSSPFAVQ